MKISACMNEGMYKNTPGIDVHVLVQGNVLQKAFYLDLFASLLELVPN